MDKNYKKGIILGILITVVTIGVIFLILCLTNVVNFSSKGSSNNYQDKNINSNTEKDNSNLNDDNNDINSNNQNDDSTNGKSTTNSNTVKDNSSSTDITKLLKGNWANISSYYYEAEQCIGDGYTIFTTNDKEIFAGKLSSMAKRKVVSIDKLSTNRYKINLEPLDGYGDVYVFDTSEINKGILKVPYSENDTKNFYTYKLVNRDSVSKDTIYNTFCEWYIKNNNVDTFTTDSNGYGKATVTGYAYTEERTDSDTGAKYKYVFFKVTETNSNNFMKFLTNYKGNSFVDDKAIGLGCFNNPTISYNNASDEFGNKGVNYELSTSDTLKIMNSSASKPIKLELQKYKLTNGGQSYNCTSLITKITIK